MNIPLQRFLRRLAIFLNIIAAAWWIWTSVQVTSTVGWPALLSSGGLLWLFFTLPPVVAVAALVSAGPDEQFKLTPEK